MGESAHTIKIENVPDDVWRGFNHLEADLGGATHLETLETIVEVYREQPDLFRDDASSGVTGAAAPDGGGVGE